MQFIRLKLFAFCFLFAVAGLAFVLLFNRKPVASDAVIVGQPRAMLEINIGKMFQMVSGLH